MCSMHEDAALHEACYGWCAPTAATEHCGWCKCRGCSWCGDGPSTGANGGSQPTSSIVGPTASSEVCPSDTEGDIAYADCQPFCAASEWRSHCSMCKCDEGCHVCSCSSEYDGGSTDRQRRQSPVPSHALSCAGCSCPDVSDVTCPPTCGDYNCDHWASSGMSALFKFELISTKSSHHPH